MTVDITVSGGEDWDYCDDWWDVFPDGTRYMNGLDIQFFGTLPGEVAPTDNPPSRVFRAKIPPPIGNCAEYSLNVAVTDIPPPDFESCYAPDGTEYDSIQVSVYKCETKYESSGDIESWLVSPFCGTVKMIWTCGVKYKACNGSITDVEAWIIVKHIEPIGGQPVPPSEWRPNHLYELEPNSYGGFTSELCNMWLEPGWKAYCATPDDPGCVGPFGTAITIKADPKFLGAPCIYPRASKTFLLESPSCCGDCN